MRHTFHDPSKGSERGENTVFTFNVDGLQICHLGDLGHVLNQNELAEIGTMDILFVPVGWMAVYRFVGENQNKFMEGILLEVFVRHLYAHLHNVKVTHL
ncbi:MAG TPA: MBL fold metallo-hydrolase [Thermodesulfobacteriota bacterium]|nr:MBL fold metallo-hydrolase [Thermodesulfobacteriota bacterium]